MSRLLFLTATLIAGLSALEITRSRVFDLDFSGEREDKNPRP